MADRCENLAREIVHDLENPSAREETGGELTVIGSGICYLDFLNDAEAEIRSADVVFYCFYDRVSQIWLHDLVPEAIDLRVFYDATLDRFATYTRMAEAMLQPVRRGKRVVAIYYGHPGIFASPAHRAIKIARREGYRARMRPGISALDYLVADLGFDPALPGLQSFEATDMLLRDRRIDPSLHIVLWQVGLIGDLKHSPQGFVNAGLPMLVDVLEETYGSIWQVTHYIAPQYVGVEPLIESFAIGELRHGEAKSSLCSLSTLYIPPMQACSTNPMRSVSLGIRRPDEPLPPPEREFRTDRYGTFEHDTLKNLERFKVSPDYFLPQPTPAADFMIALSREPELRRRYRSDAAAVLSEDRFSNLSERAAKLLAIGHPSAVVAALAEK
ncbi:SAM-dependent methyltransferase [Sphingomonas qomolangmaensis]|uniref:SAM-dependent methyltransferase n=1 Tax=Sphingomonas qomolangmaensis TaxID=2918765 RepID=A0ABY5LAC8_9SPHN|nr:SAM-dependent methyltransferase [Sphingomonas qomolangmaensis]UUL82578.1 SAM-dependent methyltransferase [Sphingomonas qomolangmaensis]